MTDWQPIETAPRDGTKFLAYEPGAECSIYACWWRDDVSCGLGDWTDTWDSEPLPRYWMPLPPPPAAEEGAAMSIKHEVRAVLEELDDDNLPDGAYWAIAHKRLGMEYGHIFDLIAYDPEFFGYELSGQRARARRAQERRG